jgi:plasmid stabilization system protein ParE
LASKLTIQYTPPARRQFLDAIRYIKADKPSAAKNFRVKPVRALGRLEDYPDSGRPIPEYPDSEYKQVVVKPYRFFYRVENQVVWVVGVWHDAQLARI